MGAALRVGKLDSSTLGKIDVDAHGNHWLHLVGKGSKAGKIALARAALDQYLMQRQLSLTPARRDAKIPLIASLDVDNAAGITATRL